jgi:competence ComEA-like helix-hairpin-helix protein
MTQKIFRRLAPFFVFGLLLAGASPAARKKHPPAKPINLNAATEGQLEELPGVGPVTAKAILAFRAKSGPFHRVEDLLAVHGVSRSKFEKLRPYVTVAPASPAPEKTPPQRLR